MEEHACMVRDNPTTETALTLSVLLSVQLLNCHTVVCLRILVMKTKKHKKPVILG